MNIEGFSKKLMPDTVHCSFDFPQFDRKEFLLTEREAKLIDVQAIMPKSS